MFLTRDIGIDPCTTQHAGLCERQGNCNPRAFGGRSRRENDTAIGCRHRSKGNDRPYPRLHHGRPAFKDGVIADFDITSDMLKHFIHKAMNGAHFCRPRVVVCIPSGVTEVERRAVDEAVRSAGAKYVETIAEPMAAAIGAGLRVDEAAGCMGG